MSFKKSSSFNYSLKILYCEDDHHIREICFKKLSDLLGAFVIQAETGEQAVSLLEKGGEFDAVVSDYNMPMGNGVDVYRSLLKYSKKTPFILYTSNSEDDFHQYMKEPNFHYVYKEAMLCDPLIKKLNEIFKRE